jgi:hypothetical protein
MPPIYRDKSTCDPERPGRNAAFERASFIAGWKAHKQARCAWPWPRWKGDKSISNVNASLADFFLLDLKLRERFRSL